MAPLRELAYYSCNFGCDPELFFATNKGSIVGAERVLPPEGILKAGENLNEYYSNPKAFVLDGVQVELNPKPDCCRANLGNQIQVAFRALKEHLESTKGGVKVNFDAVVTVSKKEMDRLSEKSREFGCEPSFNKYDPHATIVSDPRKYKKRSAGGHIHIGLVGWSPNVVPHRERLIPLMDVLLGNTCVLIDRDPYAAERRRNYGRAGEYRLPAHGIEYRTLSNFWLRSYQLFSFVMGVTRLAVRVLGTSIANKEFNPEHELLSKVDMEAVIRAINTNDLELAKRNYAVVREFVASLETKRYGPYSGLSPELLDPFDYFCDKVHKEGLQYWFPEDPLEHWCNKPEGHYTGWESFLEKIKLRMGLQKVFHVNC